MNKKDKKKMLSSSDLIEKLKEFHKDAEKAYATVRSAIDELKRLDEASKTLIDPSKKVSALLNQIKDTRQIFSDLDKRKEQLNRDIASLSGKIKPISLSISPKQINRIEAKIDYIITKTNDEKTKKILKEAKEEISSIYG